MHGTGVAEGLGGGCRGDAPPQGSLVLRRPTTAQRCLANEEVHHVGIRRLGGVPRHSDPFGIVRDGAVGGRRCGPTDVDALGVHNPGACSKAGLGAPKSCGLVEACSARRGVSLSMIRLTRKTCADTLPATNQCSHTVEGMLVMTLVTVICGALARHPHSPTSKRPRRG